MTETLEQKAKRFALRQVFDTHHLYDGQPYNIHLEQAVEFAYKYKHLVPEKDFDAVVAAVWMHDNIEDNRANYAEIKTEFGKDVAELVYAVTNEKGRTRAERANAKYYIGIERLEYATFVKLCDRLANVTYSKASGSSMFRKYKTEHDKFVHYLYDIKYDEMFSELETILL
jgi:(p)ppGpp synthase/HD superfamily hydrolase